MYQYVVAVLIFGNNENGKNCIERTSISGIQRLPHLICVFFRSSLANVELLQVSGLEDRYCICFKSITLCHCLLRLVFLLCNFSEISGEFGVKNFLHIIEPPIQLFL